MFNDCYTDFEYNVNIKGFVIVRVLTHGLSGEIPKFWAVVARDETFRSWVTGAVMDCFFEK
jgi:hypothetical protein